MGKLETNEFNLKQLLGVKREKQETTKSIKGLYARITVLGKVTWVRKYSIRGKQHRIDIGRFPKISMSEALKINDQISQSVLEGNDPKQALFSSFGLVLSQAIEASDSTDRTKDAYINAVSNVSDLVLEKNAGDIRTADIITIINTIKKTKPSVAGKLLGIIKLAYRRAVIAGSVTSNPAADLTKSYFYLKDGVGDRYLTDDELKNLAAFPMKQHKKELIFMLLVTGCRISELANMHSSQLSFEADYVDWKLEPHEHKMGRSVNAPIYRRLPKLLIPFLSFNGRLFSKQNNNHVITKLLSSSFAHEQKRWVKAGNKHWSPHDLRRTCRDNIEDFCDFSIAESILGHFPSKVVRTYSRGDYRAKQLEPYRDWMNKLFSLGFTVPLR